MSLSKNFDEMFLKPDREAEKWDDKAFELGYEGDAKKLEEHISTADNIFFDEYAISSAINEFTKKDVSREEKEEILKKLEKLDLVKEVKIEGNNFFIETEEGKIKGSILSELIIELKEDEDIETSSRKSKCHEKSMEICRRLGMPNEIVTGYIYGLSDKAKYLHSWVEVDIEGEEFVIDYTLNVMMNKSGYYLIKNAEAMSRISDKDLMEDSDIIFKISEVGTFDVKEYLLFRDEIMKDLKKNKELLRDRDEI